MFGHSLLAAFLWVTSPVTTFTPVVPSPFRSSVSEPTTAFALSTLLGIRLVGVVPTTVISCPAVMAMNAIPFVEETTTFALIPSSATTSVPAAPDVACPTGVPTGLFPAKLVSKGTVSVNTVAAAATQAGCEDEDALTCLVPSVHGTHAPSSTLPPLL